ncbi:pectinesterase family protein [Streptomyces sp. NPDC012935]|uniref:pectinesterase family protein n=1 Tax=Streptomyces sp. NPDC012935 TaxID=3364857 RepID=UPI003682E282
MRRRTLLAGMAGTAGMAGAAGGALIAAGAAPAAASACRVLHVRPGDCVQAAVDAVEGPGWTIVVHPGTYREVVSIPAGKRALTVRGATRDPRAAVIVHDNANGTKKPDGSTYGTAGSATLTSAAPGLTVRDLTIANDWLRTDHPDITGTQAVAAYTYGDRTHFENVRLLAHQDTLFVETSALGAFDRQYFHRCYIEGDVDFVFGRATAVFEDCHFHTLQRDVDFLPKGMVFAPSTARANPYGILRTTRAPEHRPSPQGPDPLHRARRRHERPAGRHRRGASLCRPRGAQAGRSRGGSAHACVMSDRVRDVRCRETAAGCFRTVLHESPSAAPSLSSWAAKSPATDSCPPPAVAVIA